MTGDSICAARSRNGVPREISTISDDAVTLTALAWYYSEIREFQGLPVKAGSMATWSLEEGHSCDRSYNNLKDRLRRDIERAEEIGKGVYGDIWQPFNPDSDVYLTLPD